MQTNHLIDFLLLDLESRGSKAVIPPKCSRLNQRDYDKEMYKWRHLIENFFCKLKDFKKIAMRAEKTDESFNAMVSEFARMTSSNF